MSLRTKFILFLGFGGVFFLFVLTVLIFDRMESAMEYQLEQQFQSDARSRIASLNAVFAGQTEHFQSTARLPMFRSMRFHELTLNQPALKNDIRQLELHFLDMINRSPELSQVRYIDKDSAEVFHVEKSGIKKNLSDMSLDVTVKEMLNLEFGNFKISQEKINGRIQNIIWWIPVYISSEVKYGVVGFSIDFQKILDRVRGLVTSESEQACLFDAQGDVLLSSHNKTRCDIQNGGLWRVYEIISLPGLSWELSLSVNPDAFLDEVKIIEKLVFGVIFPVVAFLGFIFAYIFSNHITRAIKQLVDAAHVIGRGEKLMPIKLNRNDELGELAKEMNRSAKMIEDSRNKLIETHDVLMRKERLATLGRLTATVSHELRNPLGAMWPSLSIIEKMSNKEDERVQKAVGIVNRNISRCDHIIDELLDFSHITELNRHSTRVDEWLGSVIDEQRIQDDIRVEKDFSLKDVELEIDTDRLRRVVINVADNACQAMLKNDQPRKVREGSCLNIQTRPGDERIEIVITDNGSGIEEDIIEKIFEPMFSTKVFGVGLGMPTVKQIMEQHGGGIDIDSKKDEGTTVTLWLPMGVSSKMEA